jgi:hypothetical protein
VARESAQASQAKFDTAINVGGAILGAIFGRGKVVSASTVGKLGTAARGAGRAAQQSGDVTRAAETLAAAEAQYAELEVTLQGEIDALGASYDAQAEELTPTVVKAKSSDVRVPIVAVAWVPYRRDANGIASQAWRS